MSVQIPEAKWCSDCGKMLDDNEVVSVWVEWPACPGHRHLMFMSKCCKETIIDTPSEDKQAIVQREERKLQLV